jgi:parallel beta-helix repeat protein
MSIDIGIGNRAYSIVHEKAHVPTVPSYEDHNRIAILTQEGFRPWPGSGTREDPYIIEGLRIVDDAFCLYVTGVSVHFIIRNCYFESSSIAERAVLFSRISNGVIINCTIKTANDGLEIQESGNCSIVNCTMLDCNIGIQMSDVSNITLEGNRVFRNAQGIRVDNSTACTFVHNIVYGNDMSGIWLQSYTHNCTIYSNLLGWNRESPTEQNGVDDGDANLWDDNVSQGNSWSDLETTNEPYEIGGISEVFDRYPSLLSDDENPTLSQPEDVSYDEGEYNNTIKWTCSDEYPYSYQVFRDGQRVINSVWDGSIIEVNVDNLTAGTYNYTLRLSDPIHIVFDSVIVRVYVDILSGIEPEILIASSLLSVIFVGLVLLIIKKIR